MKALLVFGLVFALDFVWTVYIAAVADKKPLKSAFWSTGTILLGGLAAVEYVKDPWMLIPAGLGAFAATYIAVRYKK